MMPIRTICGGAGRAALLLSALVEVAAAAPAWAADRAAVHVRPQDGVAVHLIQQGLDTSSSFRELMAEIGASDVYVYADTAVLLKVPGTGEVRGQMRIAASTSGGRFLRVTIGIPGNEPALVAALAHELLHAVEVARAAGVTDAKTLARYYRTRGMTVARGTFCTREARLMEARVLAEVRERLDTGSRAGGLAPRQARPSTASRTSRPTWSWSRPTSTESTSGPTA
jgi:hypothetical protein